MALPAKFQKRAAKLFDEITAFRDELEEAADAAQSKFDDMSERAQVGERGQALEQTVKAMQSFRAALYYAADEVEQFLAES